VLHHNGSEFAKRFEENRTLHKRVGAPTVELQMKFPRGPFNGTLRKRLSMHDELSIVPDQFNRRFDLLGRLVQRRKVSLESSAQFTVQFLLNIIPLCASLSSRMHAFYHRAFVC
jgi:hypothetical protein